MHALHFTHRALRTRRHALRVARYASLLACLALLTTAWTSAQQVQVVVGGQVANGTAGGTVPEGLEVTLRLFAGMEELDARTTSLGADGSFRFEDVTAEAGATFVAEVEYQGVVYVSDPATLEAGQDELLLPLTIYEVTEDPAAVLVTQMHLFISRAGDRLQLGEYYLISNTGDRTYVGTEDVQAGRRRSLSYILPGEAQNLSFDGPGLGERYVALEGGFADTRPVVPGIATVETLFSYELPYEEGMRVERRFDVGVSSIVLLVAEEGMALRGDNLISAGTLSTQMGPALSYTAGPLAAGDPLTFAVVVDPQAGMAPSAPVSAPEGSPPTRSAARETSVGLVALAVAVVVVYLMWIAPTSAPLPEPVRPVVESIAALDADFEAGRVSEQSYRRQRRALMQRVRPFVRTEDK